MTANNQESHQKSASNSNVVDRPTPTLPPTTTKPSTTGTTDNGLRIGFIGCGTIAEAIATGIARQTKVPIAQINVSRRSRQKSQALLDSFPELVIIHDDTQDLVDQSPDLVFLCVLPEHVDSVLEGVKFSPDQKQQTLISIVASANLTDLAEKTSLPSRCIAKMICTPSIAQHDGVCLLHLSNPKAAAVSTKQQQQEEKKEELQRQEENPMKSTIMELFNAVGGCVECKTEDQLHTLMSSMCVMGPLYGLMQTHIQWMISKGISKEDANLLVTRQYTAIVKDSTTTTEEESPNNKSGGVEAETRIEQLIGEQTKNGINEQALSNWDRHGALQSYKNVLDSIVDRLEGTSDGAL
eukprot:CAMPEP_0198142866 /NCGR_PEP_ID=MMETSP1443-20131203/5544_1 /TAXON_ID=186043 /ORGANISM="Entomoneis sp., Strain CCMP2396" /LENGTH=352 /DNA_ID=CAMNT_0043805975 /DNA_START=39 /DNA_END=1097 /DNA_ORIENTATION=+